MAQQTCRETFQDARLRRRRELEDTPVCRRGTALDTDAAALSSAACRVGELATLLEEQNQLLYDILGALTSLTAAQLATGQLQRD